MNKMSIKGKIKGITQLEEKGNFRGVIFNRNNRKISTNCCFRFYTK